MENHVVTGDTELHVAKIAGDEEPEEEVKKPKWQDIWFSEDDAVDLSEKNWVGKTFHYVLRLPITMILRLTIPPPAEKSWDRRFAVVSPVGATLFLFAFYNAWTKLLFSTIPWIIIFLVIAVLLGLFIKWKTQLTRPPSYLFIFTLAALVMGFHWAWACSSFIVDYLDLLGFAFRIPAIYLGITFLALGNSVTDVITSVAVAQSGFTVMAVTNIFSSPLFNMLVGLGTSFIFLIAKNGSGTIQLSMHEYSCILPIVALVSVIVLLLELILIAEYNRFVLGRRLAKGLIIGYVVFIVIATLLTFT